MLSASNSDTPAVYDDILHHPHYQAPFRTPMHPEIRAAQFAPFAAMTGFDEEVSETARLTDAQQALTEDAAAALDLVMQQLLCHEAEEPALTVTYFQPDPVKTGGAYLTKQGNLRFLDLDLHMLRLTDGSAIPFSAISAIMLDDIPEEI